VRDKPLTPVTYWLNKLSLGAAPPNDPTAFVAAAGGVLLLGILGGWLGSALFRPLAPEYLRNRPRIGMD
jgi:hypothetical protein